MVCSHPKQKVTLNDGEEEIEQPHLASKYIACKQGHKAKPASDFVIVVEASKKNAHVDLDTKDDTGQFEIHLGSAAQEQNEAIGKNVDRIADSTNIHPLLFNPERNHKLNCVKEAEQTCRNNQEHQLSLLFWVLS